MKRAICIDAIPREPVAAGNNDPAKRYDQQHYGAALPAIDG